MAEGTPLEDHFTTFKEIVADLETLEVKYEDEDLGLMLLCSLSNSYVTFRDTILYSHDTLTLNEVYEALFSKEKMKQLIVRPKTQGDSLFYMVGHKRRIIVKIRGKCQNPGILIKFAITARKKVTSRNSVSSCRIRRRNSGTNKERNLGNLVRPV